MCPNPLPVLKQLACFVALLAVSSGSLMADDEIYAAFQDPAPEMRPFARWWWNGSRVNAEETIRQLDVMKEAGIMGVEINTIGMPDYLGSIDLSAYPALEWLGAEWTEVVLQTVAAAKQRDMTADIIVGSGWPFGGEFLGPDEQTQRVRLARLTLEGPATYRTTVEEIWQESFLWGFNRKRQRELRTPTRLDLKFLRLVSENHGVEGFSPGDEWVGRQAGDGSVVVEVPQGRHFLYIGFHEVGFTEVKRGAPGADGPVVDHYNGEAVRRYLNRMSDRFEKMSGKRMGDLFRATFVDSLELDHANWTNDLEQQFLERRGYTVDPYLPFILDIEQESQPMHAGFREVVERARYDFVRTLIELFEERFLKTYVDWAADNGLKARIQAYGREMHPLHGSMVATLPEGETWIWLNRDDDRRVWVQSTVVNKYAASGAHLSGKRTVSFEAMTNAVPVFRATLNDFKHAMDLSFLDGLNHPILHGWNYFPEEVPYPGWVQFGSYLNEKNPFWPHFRKFSDYVGRIGTLLRNSDYVAQVAVLSPRGEEWARDYMLYQPFPEVWEPWYQYYLPQALQKIGFGVDHVSERVLQAARFAEGKLVYNDRPYELLVVQDVEALEEETARAILRFHQAGGKIVFIGDRPAQSHGLKDFAERDQRVAETMSVVNGPNVMQLVAPFKDVELLIPGPRGKPVDDSVLIHCAEQIRASFGMDLPVRVLNPDPHVSQIQHQLDDGRSVFFFSNRDTIEERHVKVRFAQTGSMPVVWDPATGARKRLPMDNNECVVYLAAMGSLVVVMEDPETATLLEVLSPMADPQGEHIIQFEDQWELAFTSAADGESFSRKLPVLADLSLRRGDGEVASFGGTVVYRNTFDYVPEKEYPGTVWMDLGQANGTVSLKLNGRPVGTSWYGHHRFAVGDFLLPGKNTLEATVTTVLANDIKAMSQQSSQRRWAWWYNEIPMGLEGPVKLLY